MNVETGASPGHRAASLAHPADPISNKMGDTDQSWRMSSDLHMCAVLNGHPQPRVGRETFLGSNSLRVTEKFAVTYQTSLLWILAPAAWRAPPVVAKV